MHRKLIMACMAIAAFSVLIGASAASASPALTNSEGKLVPVGTEIKGVNVGEGVFTGGFNIRCSSGEGKGKVTENSGGSVKGEFFAESLKLTGTGTSGDCTSALGSIGVTFNSKLCLATIPKTDTGEGTGCGGAPITFSLTVTGTGTCKYESAKMTASFNTNSDAVVTIFEQEAKGESTNGFFCPGSGKLDFALSATTLAGGTLLVS